MGITSLDVINNLSTCRTKIINILDFDSKKVSIIKTKREKTKYVFIMIMIHFFLAVDNLKVILKNMMITNI